MCRITFVAEDMCHLRHLESARTLSMVKRSKNYASESANGIGSLLMTQLVKKISKGVNWQLIDDIIIRTTGHKPKELVTN